MNRTAVSQQVSKSRHEALATEVNTHARGKNCHVTIMTIIKKWTCGWKLACAIARETIFIIVALCMHACKKIKALDTMLTLKYTNTINS